MPDGKDIEQEVMKEESKKQREKNNEITHEGMEETEIICPNCEKGKLWLTKTKRTFAWKCLICKWDTNRPSDFSRHKKHELGVLNILKQMFPYLTFIENTPIDANVITGERGNSPVKYDFKIFFFDKKLARCKVSVVQNIKLEHYLHSEEQYLFGQQNMIEYLAKIDGILIWFFPDDSNRVAMALARDIKKFMVEVTDKFQNKQFSLPKSVRPVVIKTDIRDFKMLIFKNFFDLLTKYFYIA